MKLYHVSYDPIWFFNPRVPKSRLPMEDAETPRICLSDRIERCVNAKPCQAQALYLAKEYGLRVPLYVYEFDTDDIPPDLLVGPDELVGQYGVIDAKLNLLKGRGAVFAVFFAISRTKERLPEGSRMWREDTAGKEELLVIFRR